MSLRDHPGYFGITSQGVIAIHADWPIYPEEHGPDLALMWLTAFPPGTAFKTIDDIDRCNLFLADVKCSNRSDPFDDRNFHVAVWNEDLLRLRSDAYIEGVTPTTPRRWEEIKRSELPPGTLFTKLPDGTFLPVELPPLEEYEDDEDVSWPEFSTGGVLVTSKGRSHAASLLSDVPETQEILGDRINRLLALGFFDTSVREGCISLEHRIKTWLASDRWGDSLVEDFISKLRETGEYLESQLRVLRGEIRMAFKFIRNDFMHNFVDVDETQARAVLFRIARIQTVVDELTAGA